MLTRSAVPKRDVCAALPARPAWDGVLVQTVLLSLAQAPPGSRFVGARGDSYTGLIEVSFEAPDVPNVQPAADEPVVV